MKEATNIELSMLGEVMTDIKPRDGKKLLPDTGLLVLQWLCLQVSHYMALNGLLLFSKGHSLTEAQGHLLSKTKVCIHLFAVPMLSKVIVNWHSVMGCALKHRLDPPDYGATIKVITEEVAKQKELQLSTYMFKHFLNNGMLAVFGSFHCEAALVCLILHLMDAIRYNPNNADISWFKVCFYLQSSLMI